MTPRLPSCAATRGLAALAALSFLGACDDPKPADPGEAGARVDPVSPPALDPKTSAQGSSPDDAPEPAPVAEKEDPTPPVAPPREDEKGPGDPAAPSPATPEPTPSPGDPASADADFTVVDFGVGTDVADRELVGRAKRFTTAAGTLHAWVKIQNTGDPRPIDMVWRKQGVETFRYTLDIGTSPSWRTWSKKTVAAGDAAPWSVQVVSTSGEVLAERSFTIDD